MRRISGIRESYQPFPPIASLNPTTDARKVELFIFPFFFLYSGRNLGDLEHNDLPFLPTGDPKSEY